jgi:hypothetical protein
MRLLKHLSRKGIIGSVQCDRRQKHCDQEHFNLILHLQCIRLNLTFPFHFFPDLQPHLLFARIVITLMLFQRHLLLSPNFHLVQDPRLDQLLDEYPSSIIFLCLKCHPHWDVPKVADNFVRTFTSTLHVLLNYTHNRFLFIINLHYSHALLYLFQNPVPAFSLQSKTMIADSLCWGPAFDVKKIRKH